jgi:phage shock protein A
MTGLFDKLNTLLQARLRGVIDGIASPGQNSPQDDGQPDDQTVESLRKRVNKAIEYENKLTAQITDLEDEIAALDDQADRAIEAGKDALGRHLVTKIQRRQKLLTMLQADLDSHRRIAQDLILQVNQLDAAVAEAEYQAQQDQADESTRFQRAFENAEDKIRALGDKIRAREAIATDDDATLQADDAVVDDDLDNRRNRLMKK